MAWEDCDGYETMGGLTYSPDLAPVGHGTASQAQGGYWPRDVEEDRHALEYLGFLDGYTRPSTGSQAGDMAASAGAWDVNFQRAVHRFQSAKGLTSDGWIGPNTRQALAVAVAKKNADEPGPPVPIPPIPPTLDPCAPGGIAYGTPFCGGAAPKPPVPPVPVAQCPPGMYGVPPNCFGGGGGAIPGLPDVKPPVTPAPLPPAGVVHCPDGTLVATGTPCPGTPAATKKSKTGTWLAVGVGLAALLGVGYVAFAED